MNLKDLPSIGDVVAISPQQIVEPPVQKEDKRNGKKGKKEKGNMWTRVWKMKRLNKPEQVAVIYLRNNGSAEPMEVPAKNGFFNIHGKTYHVNRDCIYNMGKERTPLAMIPEWSLIPIGTKKHEDKSMLEKFAELQDHVLRGIRHAELVRMGDDQGSKIKLSGKAIIGIIIGAVVALTILSQYL